MFARALSIAAAHLEKQRDGSKPGSAELERTPSGRHIPNALRRVVAERDGHCCTFTSPDGHRCVETTAENLRLLCAHHNRHEAEKQLSAERSAAARAQHERAIAEQKKAKEEEAARALTRRESDADLHAALKSLGMTREQAQIAAERRSHLAPGMIEDHFLAARRPDSRHPRSSSPR